MKAKIISVFFLIVFYAISTHLQAKEGMFLPYLLQKINASDMEAMGMRITPEEIYSVNQPSLKDAIVQFGGGCTGEIVSNQGLLLTNHHCGYRSIQRHSTVNHDYLTNGFWAQSLTEELPNQGLTATILQSMEDVTMKVLDGVTSDMSEEARYLKISENISKMVQRDDLSKFEKVEVKAFYHGNQFILMRSIVFYDVRLVGAPPSNIGKFGGDTDNWMWPRHTGDFSVFRIYVDKDNRPADYSKDNVPYKPVKFLEISLKGYEKGDFTFVFGYPGSTQEYLPSAAVQMITENVNPYRIDLRRQKLDIMGSFMEIDPAIRIQYSAKYAGVANGWKKWIGENNGTKRLETVAKKRMEESDFERWAADHKPEYRNLISRFNQVYANLLPYEMAAQYYYESAYYEDLIRFVTGFQILGSLDTIKNLPEAELQKTLDNLLAGLDGFYKDFNIKVERQLLIAAINSYRSFPYQNIAKPDVLKLIDKKFKGKTENYVDYLLTKSVFADQKKVESFLKNYSYRKLKKDPLYKLTLSYVSNISQNIRPALISMYSEIDSLQRVYMKALIEREEGQYLFPDANSTLRVSYGVVDDYDPRDGVVYHYYTTLDGIMEKENPDIYDYVVEPKLKSLYLTKDYGRYADSEGQLRTCFIASNHTTGGNSGSPVLNAHGQLIGINFDRNWEGTMSDLDYDPTQCRNIMLDIRYCLFVIDKFADANRLIEEMQISQ